MTARRNAGESTIAGPPSAATKLLLLHLPYDCDRAPHWRPGRSFSHRLIGRWSLKQGSWLRLIEGDYVSPTTRPIVEVS
jgi:hypothetical protein